MKVATQYDPFNRDEQAARDRETAARDEHQEWSRQQSLLCNAAAQRDTAGVWVKKLPDEIGRA
jgi:hypothetical protein